MTRTVLFVGDSQCEFLNYANPNFNAVFADRLAQKLKSDVHVYVDCAGWRRFADCHQSSTSPAEVLCHSAVDVTNAYCSRQTNRPFTDVVYFLGVNNLKTVLWSESPANLPANMTVEESIAADARSMMQTALGCNPVVTVTAAASLDVLRCGGSYLIDTCRDTSGTYVSPYYRSDWLRELVRNTTLASDRAAFASTAGIDYSHAATDMAHTSDVATMYALVSRLVDAVATVAPVSVGAPGPFTGTFTKRSTLESWPPPPGNFLPPPPPPPPARPEPVYTFVERPLNYADAMTTCEAMGGRLARVLDGNEWTQSVAAVQAHASRVYLNKWVQRAVWIGLNDITSEGTFEWEGGIGEGGYPLGWGSGEPNAAGGDEDCVVMLDIYNWRWCDYPCAAVASFLCENVSPTANVTLPPRPPPPPPPQEVSTRSYEDAFIALLASAVLESQTQSSLRGPANADEEGSIVVLNPEEKCSASWPRSCSVETSIGSNEISCKCTIVPYFYGILAGFSVIFVILGVLVKIKLKRRRVGRQLTIGM